MKNNNGKPEDSDNDITDDENSSLSNGHQPMQATKDWDVFTNNPPVILSGSMADQTCIQVSLQIVKLLAYICTFIFVLGGAVLSKGTLLFMTSQLNSKRNVTFCSEVLYEKQKQYIVLPDEKERVGWIWSLFFAYCIPEIMTFLRSARICFFKQAAKPTLLQFCVVAIAETLRTIGTGLLVFMILPNLDVVKGAMLTNCVSIIPGLLLVVSAFTDQQEENKVNYDAAYYFRLTINILAVAAQLTGLVVWPATFYENTTHIIVHPIALLLISCGWWENYFTATKKPAIQKFLQGLKTSRYYTFLFVSVWKIVCFFLIMLLVTYIQYDKDIAVANLFDLFEATFSDRNITITEVSSVSSSLINNLEVEDIGQPPVLDATHFSALWVLLIHALGSYICYITGKFACRILIQGTGYALPVTIAVPVVISLLITFCGLWNSDPCYFRNVIPDYMFFYSPKFYDLEGYLAEEHAWVWLLWLLSQMWITLHIWRPKVDRLMSTEVLFCMPMYESLLVDQSLALNRRHDDRKEVSTEDLDVVGHEELYALEHLYEEEGKKPGADTVRDTDHIRRVYGCATMWHETGDEMRQMLKSVLRIDSDQAARRLAQKYFKVVDPDYYEFEAHIFFDDAFEISEDNEDEVVVNKFVRDLMETIELAATDVHGTECHIRPPVKFPTPYGGRLVWTLPGKTKMIVHLKNKDKIRHKKRWSQVMYMYYLLGHRLMELPIDPNRKEVIASNTFLLALDGDIDFKPEAVLLLLDLMKKDKKLGAACGRIHPTGKGPMVWYQKFEYAIGHWLQKATEHVIGCVLCSPGCFSLFRGEALMDDAVMNKYTTVSKEARHYVQYDQGEDRWLCTLLLQRGYRVEYSAASDAYTQSPEGFDEFYNQRRRWIPSTMANILDLLMDYKRTVKINNNISLLYIVYQAVLFGGSILGPGNIFLMLVGAFVAAFKIDNWTSFLYNIVPILTYMFVCFLCKEKIQLITAKIISAIYGLVMMAVLVGIMLQIYEDGPLAPSSLFFFIVAAEMIIAAFLHPQEFDCLISGVVYYVTVPSMYLLLIVYAIFNLNVVSWGTREIATKKSKAELEQEKKAAEEAKKQAKKKSFWGFLTPGQKNKDKEAGSFEFSIAGLFKCMLCTHPKDGEEKLQLMRIADSMEKLNRRLDSIERAVAPTPQTQQRRRTTIKLSNRDLDPLIEGNENIPDEDTGSSTDNEDPEPKEVRDEQVTPYWIDHHPEMKKGFVDFLPSKEVQFWNDLIDKYLYVLKKDVKKEKEDSKMLKDLRDIAVFAFFMLNAIFVLVIFLLQLSKDQLHIDWPFNAKSNITFDSSLEITISREYLQLEPIGMLFIIFFGIILIIQFIAMLIHRFGTLSHMLATTEITWFRGRVESDDQHTEARAAVQLARKFQELRGADGELLKGRKMMEEGVGRRKTVQNIQKMHFLRKKQAVHSLDIAFKRRMSQAPGKNGEVSESFRKLTIRRETVTRLLDKGRKSIVNERRMSQMRRESRMGPKNNIRPGAGALPTIPQEV